MKAILAIGCLATASAFGIDAIDTNSAPESTPSSAGSVAGKFSWDGDIPEALAALSIDAEKAKGCCAEGESVDSVNRSLLISEDGGIANVVVTFELKDGEIEHEPRAEPVVLDQSKCRFEPHITVVRVGDKVRYANSDQVNHNVHTTSKKNPAFNNNVAAGKFEERECKFAEVISVVCDIHPWMSAYVYITDADYWGVSGLDGTVRVEGLQPGTYKAEYWHEKLGKGRLEDVVVAEGGAAEFEQKLKESARGGRRRGR